MSQQDRICIFCLGNGQVGYSNAPEIDGTNCVNPPDCPCENLLSVPSFTAANPGVTQIFTSYHPDPAFPVVGATFDPCDAATSTICYACNQTNTGYISQTLPSGGPCPTGWSTTIPTCEGSGNGSSTSCPPPTSGCSICFDEQCSSVGATEVSITFGTNLSNINIQNGAQSNQLTQCQSPVTNPFMTTVLPGDTITVSGYCGTPSVDQMYNADTDPGDPPVWVDQVCGTSTIASDTIIYAFYDNTSLDAAAKTTTYNALKSWVAGLGATFTGNVYHVQIGGEDWVQWMTYGIDNTNVPTSSPIVLPDWNSDASPYSQGSNGTTIGLPSGSSNSDNILVLIFADESHSDYHSNSENSWGGSPTLSWRTDYDEFITTVTNFNAGTGSFKAFVYPSARADGNVYSNQKAFPLHVLGGIEQGTLAVAPTVQPNGVNVNVSAITTSNPYAAAANNSHGASHTYGYGGLSAYNVGYNVQMDQMNAVQFAADLDAFLNLGSSQCGGTDCARVRVTKADGTPVAGENIMINTTSYNTDAQGYTAMATGLVGLMTVGCTNYNFSGNCTNYLFTVIKEEETFTSTLTCVLGCTDPTAINYNPNANIDDGSCEYCVWGCTNPTSLNYDPAATCDDGSCQDIPDIVECTMINMSKEILKQCYDECGDPEAYQELLADYREMEAILAQIYMLIECDKLTELQALMPKILRLMEKYQCDSCYNYNNAVDGDPTQTQDETSATTCGATISGPCTNKLLIPAQDALQIETKLTPGGSWTIQSTTSNTVLGDISGKSLDVQTYCGPVRIEKTLNACGLETIPNDTNIYCFYDVTSTCKEDIVEIVNAVELWFQSKVIADPTFAGDVFHIPVHGEKWLRCGEYPYNQAFHAASTSLVNGSGNDLGGGNAGYSTTLTVNVLDRSTIGTTNTIVSQQMYGPKGGSASFNDIVTGSGALPYLKSGASYANQGLASGASPDTKAVVLCFFDEAEGPQGGGHYHDRVGDSHLGYPPQGILADFGTAPGNKWITDYNSFTGMHNNYSFFKGFLYPVIPGIHSSCGTPTNTGDPHTGKMSFLLASLAGIHSGVWNTATDGPVPVNPVVSATAHPGTGVMGTLDAVTLAGNPFVAQGVDGLDEYGWSMDATVGTPGTNSIAGVFTGGTFTATLDSLLSGGSTCNGTDCLTVIVKDADTGAIINDIYSQSATTVPPGTYQILHPSANVTVQTDGNCTEYIVTVFKDVMDTYSDCVITSEIACGCEKTSPKITISVGASGVITGTTVNGETSYGYIKNETTGVEEEIIFDPNVVGPLTGGITLDSSIKNTALFGGTEMPDGRYKIVLTNVDGKKIELCYLILCDSYSKILDAFERFTLQIDCCPTCTSPYDKYLEGYTLYRVLKMTGLDCGLEKWIDKNITKLQGCCSSCGADAECNQTC